MYHNLSYIIIQSKLRDMAQYMENYTQRYISNISKSVTVLTLWVAPPNELCNCTHFRHPTDEQLRLQIFRATTICRLSSLNWNEYIYRKDKVNDNILRAQYFMMILFTLPHYPIFLWRTLTFAANLVFELKPKLISHHPFLFAFILRSIVHITREVISNQYDKSTTVVTLTNTQHILNNIKRLFIYLLGITSIIRLSETRLKIVLHFL